MKHLGSFPQVSHCYERPTYADWPYNVFSMIHCKTHEEANEMAKTIQDQISVDEYKILFSSREFKKTRVEYFVENSFTLEETISCILESHFRHVLLHELCKNTDHSCYNSIENFLHILYMVVFHPALIILYGILYF